MDVWSYTTRGRSGKLTTHPAKFNLLKEFGCDGEQRDRADDKENEE